MPRRITSLIILAAALSQVTFAQQRTVIRDAKAAGILLGRHKLSLQWISWDYFGTATVTNRAGVYYLKGEQKGRGRGNTDFLRIDGVITEINAKQFTFDGTVALQVSHINGGQPCERKGNLNFRITGARRYWRMQEMGNPCDEATDYVDIFFR
jgi:hypothetical protein